MIDVKVLTYLINIKIMLLKTLDHFTKLVFFTWLKVSKVLGLILIEYNEKDKRFVSRKYAKLQCILMGIINAFLFPIAIIYFVNIMNVAESKISFAITVSSMAESLMFFNMIYGYYCQFVNHDQMIIMMNETLIFYNHCIQEFPQISQLHFRIKYQCFFTFAVLIKLFIVLQNEISILLLIDLKQFNVLVFATMLPYVVSLVVCNQFFMGVLSLNYLLSVIHLKIAKMIQDQTAFLECSLKISDQLDELSIIHRKLYNFHEKLSKLFSFQMLISTNNSFVSLVLNCYYYFFINYLKFLNINYYASPTLEFMSIASLVTILTDIAYDFTICAQCFKVVSTCVTVAIFL